MTQNTAILFQTDTAGSENIWVDRVGKWIASNPTKTNIDAYRVMFECLLLFFTRDTKREDPFALKEDTETGIK